MTVTALIVDDEAERRADMRCGLSEHGLRSDEAATVGEAIHLLSARAYDLVVCDMVLCDPPEAANPAPRGYLVVCFALSRPAAPVVVQASSYRRWRHAGALLTNWAIPEVADVVYGSAGIPAHRSEDGGCPWSALSRLAAAPPAGRPAAVRSLTILPLVQELEGTAGLGPVILSLEDAAEGAGGAGGWDRAVEAAWQAFFPGAGRGR